MRDPDIVEQLRKKGRHPVFESVIKYMVCSAEYIKCFMECQYISRTNETIYKKFVDIYFGNICFSIDHLDSFSLYNAHKDWWPEIRNFLLSFSMNLVGNKLDLRNPPTLSSN
nr:unnamed protein product [Callosobruchus chinensis]